MNLSKPYIKDLGYTLAKVKEILLEIYKEVKKRIAENSEYELLAAVCSEIGSFYLNLKSEKAERFLLEAFNLRTKLYGSKRAFLLSNTMNRLGIYYIENGKTTKAEIVLEDAYMIIKDLYKRDSRCERDFEIMASHLGTSHHETLKPKAALEDLSEALKHKYVLPCKDAIAYYNLALTYEDFGEIEGALKYYHETLKLQEQNKLEIIDSREVINQIKTLRGEFGDGH